MPIVEFDFEGVGRDLGEAEHDDLSRFTQDEVDRALAVFRALLDWVWQHGMKNPEGLKIRAIIVCWIFLAEARPLTLTELARGFGMKKQSLGRWVDQFKRRFKIQTPHMRSLDDQ